MRLQIALLLPLSLFYSSFVLAAEPALAVREIDLAVAKKADWLNDAEICPAALLPKDDALREPGANTCRTALGECLSRCDSGDANSCYWLAYAVQQGKGKTQTSEALFQRACRLGIVSGCTNRAAGMEEDALQDKALQRCAVRTFALGCSHDDPWACTMYAFHLTRGMGVKADLDQALHALEKSCTDGPEDPACRYGNGLKEEIAQAKRKAAGAR